MNKSLVERYARWVVKWRWLVLLSSILVVMGAGAGGQFLGMNNDYRVFFGEDNPQLIAFDELQDKYTKDDNIFLVIEPKDGKVFSKKTLVALQELSDSAWLTPYSTRVDALTNFQYTHSEGDDMFVEDLARDLKLKTETDIRKIEEIALAEPLLRNRLVNEEGTITAVNITVTIPGKKENENLESAAFVRKLTARWSEKHPDFNIYFSGMSMMNETFAEVAEGDATTLMPMMFIIIILMVGFTSRSASGTFSSFLILVFSIMVTMGFAGWMGMDLNAITFVVPTLVMTLAIADSIHILVTMLQHMRKGAGKREAIVQSLKINFAPVFITSVTTAIGFLTLNFSDSPPFRDLGNMTAMGVMTAFIFSVTFLPAVMAILPSWIKEKVQKEGKISVLDRFANFIIEKRTVVLIASTIAVLTISAFAMKNEINTDFVAFFDERVPFRTDTDYISDTLTGIFTIEYSLGSGEAQGINDPKYLKKLKAFEDWWRQQESVLHVNSFHEVHMRTNRALHGDSTEYYTISDDRQSSAQFLLLYEMSLPYGLDLNNQVNVDKSETRFTITTENIRSREMIALSERGEQWLKDNAPEYMFGYAVSPTLMFSHLGFRQADSMIRGTGIALILISLILMFALRSLKYGTLSLIPNVAPMAVGFGIWGIIDGLVHPGITIVFGMTLGIIVDDTVHFLTKYKHARKVLGKSAEDAIRYSFTTVGIALIVTTVVLVAGFSVLSYSSFAMNSGMGKLTAITIAVALIIDFFLLPTLLLLVDRKSAGVQQQEQPQQEELELENVQG